MLRITGDLERAAEVLQQALASYPPSVLLFEMANRASAALLAVATDRLEEANQHLEVCRGIIAQGEDWRGRTGLIERAEGAVAAAQGGIFAPHFEKSVAIFKRYSLPWDEAGTLYIWGLALNKRGEHSNANEKFDAAVEIYRRHGAGQRWIDRVEAARPSSAVATASPKRAEITSISTILKKDGDFWTITHRGNTFRLRNLKGLAYIGYLLAHPGVRIHVRDLVAMVEGGATRVPATSVGQARADGLEAVRDLGDAGETLDPQAISEYRIRLAEVREELADAERNNDSGTADRYRQELELLTRQLSAGVGRGGRARRSSSHVERARALVTKNIRASVERIRHNDVKLAEHLTTSIRTGAFCAYLPDLAELENISS